MTAQALDSKATLSTELPRKEYAVERPRVPLVLKLFGLTALLIAIVVAVAVGITIQRANSVAQATVNTVQAPNLVRSAIAPLISATVMTANVSWKAEKMRSGMPFTRVTLFTSPCSPRYAKPPMNPLPFPNDSESPYRTQAIVTVMMATHDIIIMFRTLLARLMPP